MRRILAASVILVALSASPAALAQDAGVLRERASQPQQGARTRGPQGMSDGGVARRPRATPARPRPTQMGGAAQTDAAGPAQAIEPAPTEPAPTEPASTEHGPIEPGPIEPGPIEPRPVEPAPEESSPPAVLLDGGVPSLDDAGIHAADASLAYDGSAVELTDPADAGLEDAGPADGGASAPSDAGVAPPAPATPAAEPGSEGIVRAAIDALARLAGRDRTEPRSAEQQPVAGAAPSVSGAAPPAESGILNDLVREWLGVEPPPSFGLVVLIGLAVFALWLIERARRPLPEGGLAPRVLGAARLVLRASVVLLALLLVSRLLPDSMQPLLLVILVAAAVALGFGATWVLVPDVVSGLVLLTEGRLRRGQWIAGEGFAGTLEQVGPRVTLLRTADGALIAIPNRRVVKSPVRATDRPWHEAEVEIETPAGAPAPRLREAITEAVLCSPYVPPDPRLVLARDPRRPDRWHVRVRLIDGRFSAAFEGQLLERVEESLALGADRADPGA